MVKKKGKSKRTTLKDKYKIIKRTKETHRKRKKEENRDKANGVVRPNHKSKKDPGIPNSWPFKEDLLKTIQRQKERQQQLQDETNERRKVELQALRDHQAAGGTARTVKDMMEQASRDQAQFQAKQGVFGTDTAATAAAGDNDHNTKIDGSAEKVAPVGQQSRRAYLRELKKVIDTADVILQVLDARDPVGSRIHPAVEDIILSRSDKRMVLVLNKIDLVPKDVITAWLNTLRRFHPTIAIKASANSLGGSSGGSSARTANDNATTATNSQAAVGMDGLLQLLKNYARTGGAGGKSKTTIVVGIIGYPNVGKSSIINALKRTRAVGVSPRPGFTTSMQEVVLDKNLRLLDSPGVVFNDHSAMLGNCVDAESLKDPIPAIDALLKRCNHASLLMTYNIPTFPPGDVMMFLALVAKTLGRVLKGGIPDKLGAARRILKDWNQGKIPYFTVPPRSMTQQHKEGSLSTNENTAVIVSQFADKEFDCFMTNSGNNKDEMDFVQLEEGEEEMARRPEISDADLKVLAGKEDDDDDDDDEEDSDDNNSSSNEMDEESVDKEEKKKGKDKGKSKSKVLKSRNTIAKAEDYDFDMM